MIFWHVTRIPIGSHPAIFFANLFLHYYEWTWIHQLSISNSKRAKRFANVSQFIDDLKAINNVLRFERIYKEIYSPDLAL